MSPARQAIIALGSNLGDRRENLERALVLLAEIPKIQILARAPIYETAPVGVTDQPSFLNTVAAIETGLEPEALMRVLLETEKKLGRIRTVRWGPRTIDLDLLFFENEIRSTDSLTLPHPRWKERTFVTIPLRDLLKTPALSNETWNPLREQLRRLPPDATGVRENTG